MEMNDLFAGDDYMRMVLLRIGVGGALVERGMGWRRRVKDDGDEGGGVNLRRFWTSSTASGLKIILSYISFIKIILK
jgi:hypothetical protein